MAKFNVSTQPKRQDALVILSGVWVVAVGEQPPSMRFDRDEGCVFEEGYVGPIELSNQLNFV